MVKNVDQMQNYSSHEIHPNTPCTIMPFMVENKYIFMATWHALSTVKTSQRSNGLSLYCGMGERRQRGCKAKDESTAGAIEIRPGTK